MTKAISEKSADTAILESLIRELQPNGELTYDAMTQALGRDVRKFCYHNLASARRICSNDKIETDTIPTVGIKRLDDIGIVDSMSSDTRAISRRARRIPRKVLAISDLGSLPPEKKQEAVTKSAQAGAIELFASSKGSKAIAGKANGKDNLSIGDTLRLFTE